MRYLLIIAMLVLIAPPVVAQDSNVYYIFVPGSDTAQEWIGPEPIPGQHCPEGSKVILREVINNDLDVHNYRLSSDGTRLEWFNRDAEAAAAQVLAYPPVPMPNPRLLQSLVMSDANIPVDAKRELMKYFALLGQNANNLAGLRAGWQILTAEPTEPWLTPEVKSIVEGYAVQSHMPLTE